MKKFFFFAAIAAMALVACDPETEENKGGKEEEGGIKLEYRIKTLDGKPFTYDAEGRIVSYGNDYEIRTLIYEGNKVTIKDKWRDETTDPWSEEIVEYELTLNEQGFATEVKYGDNNVVTITYDKDGFFTEAKKNGEKITGQTIEDNNVMAWERYDSKNDYWRQKKATYLDKDNVGQVQTHWAEDLGMKRWMHEARFFGNTSVKVLETCRWYNYGDEPAASTAVYDYEYDANGCITKETKYYGEWNETDLTGLDFDDEHTFTWEKI
ncbi:MAG: hypothetical protein J6X77_01955 [Bacteroidales bacterium]|nr:hypothetical protein [Bacteroidales bacterium]